MRQPSSSVRHARFALAASLVVALSAGCSSADAPGRDPACALWMAIGDRPSPELIKRVASRYDVVVLHSWDTDGLAMVREANPDATVLVYKDLSAVVGPGGTADGSMLTGGIAYTTADTQHPEWFALDTAGQRIDWNSEGLQWQMTVWDPNYQQAWADAVTTEVVEHNWDGVYAENDIDGLSQYSPVLLAGTNYWVDSDRQVREGLDQMVSLVGARMQRAGKLFVPSISSPDSEPDRWDRHSRFGGGADPLFAFDPNQQAFDALAQPVRPEVVRDSHGGLTLLQSPATDAEMATGGFAAALLVGGGRACWTGGTDGGDDGAPWSSLQSLPIGSPTELPVSLTEGLWQRSFTGGWVAVNAGFVPMEVTPPDGLVDQAGNPGVPVTLAPRSGLILVRE